MVESLLTIPPYTNVWFRLCFTFKSRIKEHSISTRKKDRVRCHFNFPCSICLNWNAISCSINTQTQTQTQCNWNSSDLKCATVCKSSKNVKTWPKPIKGTVVGWTTETHQQFNSSDSIAYTFYDRNCSLNSCRKWTQDTTTTATQNWTKWIRNCQRRLQKRILPDLYSLWPFANVNKCNIELQ